jgi:two-component system phosphate regulon sensor histidine kinase PhoR
MVIRFSRPDVEEIEEKLYSQEKNFKKEKNILEIENRMYKIMFNAIEDPIMVLSPESIVIFANIKFMHLFGVKENVIGTPIMEVTRNFDFQNFIKENAINLKQNTLERFTFQEGTSLSNKYFNIRIIPIKFSGHLLIVFHDVSERILTDQIREEFISNFSHEIRTPLTILNGQIQSFTGLIKNKNIQDPKFDEYINKIENNSRRLTSLFEDILSLTTIEKIRKLDIEEISIQQLVEIVIQDLASKYPTKKVKTEFNINAATLKADYRLIEQAILNLIDNAFKYSHEQLILSISTNLENDNFILSIKDNGIGIPENQRNRIFERFFRIDLSRSSEISGTGLGLSIVKHIIQKHNGKIRVSNDESTGSNFIITIPN